MGDVEMDELTKQTEVFTECIAKAAPSLGRRASALTRSYWKLEGQYGGLMPSMASTEDFEQRGLVLVDRYQVIRGDRGSLTLGGTCLVLLTDGTLAELLRSGTGDEHLDEAKWEATLRGISPRDAVARYGLAACTKELKASSPEGTSAMVAEELASLRARRG